MTTFTDAQLDAFRQRCDPVADRVVERIIDAGLAAELNLMVSALVENDDGVPPNLPEAAQAYFEQTATLPAWVDLERVRRGQAFFSARAPEMALMLSLASLPVCYGCADGAQVLLRSHRIAEPANRRILETTQFVLDVMDVGGLDPDTDGRGLRSIQKVRLMHAAIRHYIQHPDHGGRGATFKPEWGKPINQEDMVNTLMSFSRVPINGLRRLGHRFSAQDEADYFYAWRVVGHLMGVDDGLNPATVAEGQALLDQICRKNSKPSEAGTELTAAVLDYIAEVVPLRFADGIGASMLRKACGDGLADMLGVPPADWTRFGLDAAGLLATVGGLFGRELGHQRLWAFAGRMLLTGFVRMERAKPAHFRIPPSLTGNWVA